MLLSIITVNLNNHIGLEKTIQSVINQSFKNFEYIIIDGGSEDDSLNVIKKFASYINYWVSEKDDGIYNAMNKGISKATGEYCLFLNSGDSLSDDSILHKVFSLNREEDIIYGNRKEFFNNVEKRTITFSEKLSFYFFYTYTLGHQSTFIRRKLFDIVGNYNENKKFDADWEFFMIATAKHNCSYAYVPITICNYDLHGISAIDANREEMMNERLNTLKHHFPLFVEDYEELVRLKREINYYRNRTTLNLIKDIIKKQVQKIRILDK